MEMSYNFTKVIFSFLTIIALAQSAPTPSPPQASNTNTNTNYIRNKCRTATYSKLCYQTLYPYASFVQTSNLNLCNAAVTVAIQGVRSANKTIFNFANQKGLSKMDMAALRDCKSDMRDAVSELKKTNSALKRLKGRDRQFQWANAKTYGSAAESDIESCRDGFAEKKKISAVGLNIRSSLLLVEQRISNALYLINHLY
ncbi:OLC1v1027211C1 [Oldenlandia corymbosa var. corymbosa]|uniref:OLC1v1027211C1 n=1 Tax=Oldenlandia corymbosa var. corymbosa TaxID=529605 RepID=A0AAV1CBM2_OLDCO|nr:OLC1v1027211C1 [Oldenlandia corymbosa var. corymbosa]